MSQIKVNTLLRKQDLKPCKTKYWCEKISDLKLVSEMIATVGLYLNSPKNAVDFGEKTQYRHLPRHNLHFLYSPDCQGLTATYYCNILL